MKKILISLLSIMLLSVLFFTPKIVNADTPTTPTEIETQIVVPNSYLEFYSLNEPLDVWTNETEFVIAESNRIVYYNGSSYEAFDLSSYSVSLVYKKGNFILFLSSSRIYSINVTSKAVNDTGIITASSFDVYNNTLATNPSGEIHFYYITDSEQNFTADELVSAKISLPYTPNALCLISEDTLYFMHEESLIKASQASRETIKDGIASARSICYGNDFIYVSTSDGLYKFNPVNGVQISYVKASATDELKNLGDPRGIYFYNQNIYIADNYHNAISKYSFVSDSFSNFKITAEYGAVDRISTEVQSIFSSEKSIYVVDKNEVKVIDENSNVTEISLKGFYDTKYLATNSSTFLISNGNNLNLCKLVNGQFQAVTFSGDLSKLQNVTSICVFENDYYVLNNETINNTPTAVVYKLSSQTSTLTKHSELAGRGDAMTCDVFGDVYVEIYSEAQSKYFVYANDISASKHKLIHSGSEKLISIYADYEGNLFSLTENNKIIKTSGTSETEYSLKLSENLPSAQKPIGFATSQNKTKTYVLYNGFVLTVNNDDFGISTPKKIKVPENFALTLDKNPTFVQIKNGAKLFEVSITSATDFGEYFNYEHMSANDESSIYFLITTTERYSLIANATRSAIVRTEDVEEKSLQTDEIQTTMYAVNNCKTYSYPLIRSFNENNSLEKNAVVTVLKTFTLNDTEFCYVESGSVCGYVTKSMLKNGIAFELSPQKTTSYKTSETATVYKDKAMLEEFSTLEKGSQISVIETEGNVTSILIDGTIYYVNSSAITPKGNVVIRNMILISLLALALFVTAIYIIYRIMNSKQLKR